MGVLDRLRRRSPEPDVSSAPVDTLPAASMPEQRGDFMLLPPMRPTFGSPVHLQRNLDDFLVTHRPVGVTKQPLAHDIEPERMGTFVARSRRVRARPRPRQADLRHRLPELAWAEDDAAELPPLPPVPAPRRLPATAPQAPTADAPAEQPPALPVAQLPTPAEVRRRVSTQPAVQPIPGATPATTPPDEAAALPSFVRTETSDEVPVLRRRASRGRVNEPIAAVEPFTDIIDLGDALGEAMAEVQAETPPTLEMRPSGDAEVPPVPTAASMPELTGDTRVRGSAAPSRPNLADAAPLARSADVPTPTPTAREGAEPELVHRAETARESAPEASRESAPEASRPSAPAAPSPAAAPPASFAPAASVVTPDVVLGAAPEPGPRPILGGRAPLVTAGRTGVQRLARADDRPPMARPVSRTAARTAPSAPSTPSVAASPATAAPEPASAAPSGVAAPSTAASTARASETAATPSSTPAPTMVDVPQRVREAVTQATGTAPAQVPVHQGEHVDAMTDEIKAQAFTRDGEIYLAGDAQLGTPKGEEVLAHELTHVVQQQAGAEAMPHEASEEGREHESEAREVQRAVAQPALAMPPAVLQHAPSGSDSPAPEGVQRLPRFDDPWNDQGYGADPWDQGYPMSASAMPYGQQAMPPMFHRQPMSSMPSMAPMSGPMGSAYGAGPFAPVPAVRDGRDVYDDESDDEPSGGVMSRAGGMLGAGAGMLSGLQDTVSRTLFGDDDDGPSRGGRGVSGEEATVDPRAELERQASQLYPLIRSRLRAELVRDRERRGRLAREWR